VSLGRRIWFVPASAGAFTLAGSTPVAARTEESVRMPTRRAIRLEARTATVDALGVDARAVVVWS